MIYFGYCTLLDVDEMRRLCPGARPIGVGRMTGHRLCFSGYSEDPTRGSCDLADAPGHEMWGLMYEMVPAEYDALDVMAGVPRGHLERIDVEVIDTDGVARQVTTYSNPDPAGPFSPSADYVKPILAGARKLSLPAGYVEELDAIVAAARAAA